MPPKLSLSPKRGRFFSSFKTAPAVRVIAQQLSGKIVCARQFLPRGIKMPLQALWLTVNQKPSFLANFSQFLANL